MSLDERTWKYEHQILKEGVEMTRDETKKILMMIQCSFPNWKPTMDMSFVIDVWNDDLQEYSYEQIFMALKSYKATNTSGFAPNVGQIIDRIHNMNNTERELNPNEAWAMVYKALCNSTYHAQEEFDALPEKVQKAVGSPDILRNMASDMNFNEGVEKSLFTKTYISVCKRAEEDAEEATYEEKNN